jgi:hypothetical protein
MSCSALSAGAARGQGGPASVEVSAQSCSGVPPVDLEPFLGILTAELRADGVERVIVTMGQSGESKPGEPQSLAVLGIRSESCDAPRGGIVVVHIEDAATRKSVERRVQLTDVEAPSRPRTLALAVAELLRASWLELAMPDAPPPQAPVPQVVRQAVETRIVAMAPPVPATRGEVAQGGDRDVSVTAAWRAFPTAHSSLLGGQVAVELPVFGKDWLARVDTGAVFASTQDALGDIALSLGWLGGAFLYTSRLDAPFGVAVGPRLDVGIAWASGNPQAQTISSSAGSGAISSLSLLGSVRQRIGGSWRAALELQTGAVVVPFEAQADSRRVTGIAGALFGVAIGVTQLR